MHCGERKEQQRISARKGGRAAKNSASNREQRKDMEKGGIPNKVKPTQFQSISVNIRRVWIHNLQHRLLHK